jgi:hypothetical protein
LLVATAHTLFIKQNLNYGTKIVLKCEQLLRVHFKHIKRKDETIVNKVKISVHCVLHKEQ